MNSTGQTTTSQSKVLKPLASFVSFVANWPSAYLLLMLRTYKTLLSPMLPNACRFVPTCSEYASDAIAQYGAVRGGLKAVWRVLRCNPFSAGGYDPAILPEKSVGEPVCVCQARQPTTEPPERAPVALPAHPLSSLNLRLNHFWRC